MGAGSPTVSVLAGPSALGGPSMAKRTGPCAHCWAEKPTNRGGLCMACYQYRRRTGQDRPIDLLVKEADRIIERYVA